MRQKIHRLCGWIILIEAVLVVAEATFYLRILLEAK
jgi:hypothetical protein